MLISACKGSFILILQLNKVRNVRKQTVYLQCIWPHSNVQDLWAVNHHLSQAGKLNPTSNHLYHLAVSEQNAYTTVAVKIEQTINSYRAPFHAEESKHLQSKVNYHRFYWHEKQHTVTWLLCDQETAFTVTTNFKQ